MIQNEIKNIYYRGQSKNYSESFDDITDIKPSILRNDSISLFTEADYYIQNIKQMEEVLKIN